MGVSTGSSALDSFLGAGLPERRALLVTGGPGVGKSVFGMQFLQAGLDAGEPGLLVTTGQTPAEVRASFEGFAFDLDHPDLTVVSIRSGSDGNLEVDVGPTGDQPADDEAEGEPSAGDPGLLEFDIPFEFRALVEVLEPYDHCDRVVFDSGSGLADLEADPARIHQLVLDLIRLFGDRFEATTVLTAEADGAGAASISRTLEHAANGVVRLRDERVEGTRCRFMQVQKLRGVDHDLRERAYHITAEGIRPAGLELAPTSASRPDALLTGDPAIDERCGGLALGGIIALEHDVRSIAEPIVVQLSAAALAAGMGIWLVPPPVLTPGRFDELLPADQPSVEELLETDRLYVLDLFSSWDRVGDHSTVFAIPNNRLVRGLVRGALGTRFAKRVIARIDRRRGDRAMFAPVYLDAFSYLLGDVRAVRELYFWARQTVTDERDTAFYVYNPGVFDDQTAETFRSDADQLFEVTTDETGHQTIRLGKTRTGSPGARVPMDVAGFDGA